jgi:hypothetical protein
LVICSLGFGDECIQVAGDGRMCQDLEAPDEVRVLLSLVWANNHSDRDIPAQRLLITGQDCPMLRLIQVQLEHNPLGSFGQLATFADEDWAHLPRTRSRTNHHPMTQLFEELTVGRLGSAGYIEEEVVLHIGLLCQRLGGIGCDHKGTKSLVGPD